MKKVLVLFIFALILSVYSAPAKKAAKAKASRPSYPPQAKVMDYPCTIDNSKQKAIVYLAKGKSPRPLLVALHTWGGTYQQSCWNYAQYCVKNNWNFIFPHFRGQNWNPDGCGSDKAVQDIVDAVAYMKKAGKVDEKRVYLIGGSGGGHATLLLAGRHPELWTAVSAWCPISDIAAWHNESTTVNPRYKNSYAKHIERACGGNPQKDPKAKAQAAKRSPLTYLARAAKLKVDINAGIHDGYKGSVLTSHSLNAFNVLADKKDQLSKEEINSIVRDRKVPAKFGKPETDPVFGRASVLFRRQSNLVRVTIFNGGHTILAAAGLDWLARQSRDKKVDWSVRKNKKAAKAAEIHK